MYDIAFCSKEGRLLLCDIRDEEKSITTLERLTGIESIVWSMEITKNTSRIDYTYCDKDIKRVIKEYDGCVPSIDDLELVVIHVTTSGNGCVSILEDGIIDLKDAYQKQDSELRLFLDSKGIDILLDSCCLKYKGKSYDISFGDCPSDNNLEKYAAWSVGRKFYYDFSVCGFFSINYRDSYGGDVHKRPEILLDLDRLLGTKLQEEWLQSHQAFEIVFSVPIRDVVCDGWNYDTEEDVVMSFLMKAYMCASSGPDTKEVICKKGIHIYPKQILECDRFILWN